MDDTQDKARRNLVFFCSVVLFCGWLGFDEVELVKRVFGGGSDVVGGASKIRIVLVALTTLVYLSLRYRFSDTFVQFVESIRDEWQSEVMIQARKVINLHLLKMANKDAHSIIFNMNLREHLSKTVSQTCNQNAEQLVYKLNVGNFGFRTLEEGSCSFEFEAVNKSGRMVYSTSGGSAFQYKLDALSKFYVLLKVFLLKFFYSKTSVEYVVPLVLAFSTALLLMFRVVVLL